MSPGRARSHTPVSPSATLDGRRPPHREGAVCSSRERASIDSTLVGHEDQLVIDPAFFARHAVRWTGAVVLISLAATGCGSSSKSGATTSSKPSGATPSSAATAAAGSGDGTDSPADVASAGVWPADTCTVIDQTVLGGIIGIAVTSSEHQPTLESVCYYKGAVPPSTDVGFVSTLTFYDDRSEWDIYIANSGVSANDKLAGVGADAFKSADGIWVLLDDGRMFIADVAYGIADESAKELALATAIAATAS